VFQKIRGKYLNKNTEYEIFVKEIYEKILEEESEGKAFNVKHDITIKGKSGATNQIDVYFEKKIVGKTIKFAIECKNYSSRVSVEKIRAFKSVLEDINSIGIFVSREGFQSGAKKFAQHHDITLVECRFPKLEDWSNRFKTIHLNIDINQIKVLNRNLILDKEWCKKFYHNPTNEFILEGSNAEISLKTKEGDFISTLYTLEQKLPVFLEDKDGIKKKSFYFEDAYIENEKGDIIKINGIEFEYKIFSSKENIIIDGEKSIKGILKDPITGEIEFIKK